MKSTLLGWLFLVFFCLLLLWYSTQEKKGDGEKESFTPYIRSIYKPRVRSITNVITSQWNRLKDRIHFRFKKLHII